MSKLKVIELFAGIGSQTQALKNIEVEHEVIGISEIDKWLNFLEGLGYSNFWQVLNAKDYGIPQNRERVFVVSILKNTNYTFPIKKELKLYLKDFLEEEVEDKYFIS